MVNTDKKYQVLGIGICPLCHSTDSTHTVAENPTFGDPVSIGYCDCCEIYFSARIPDAHELDAFYRTEYFSDTRASGLRYYLKSWFATRRALSQYRYLQASAGTAKGREALEVGCADGTFLAQLSRRGWRVRGLEYNEFMITQAKHHHGLILEQRDVMSLVPVRDSFDCVVLLHVLEHMPDPLTVLAHCRQLLRPGGLLFMELPHSPKPDEVDSETLDFYLTTTHLYNFRPPSFAALTEQAGFHVKSLDRFYYPVPGILHSSSRDVGRILMNGSFHKWHPVHLAGLVLTVSNLAIYSACSLDPLKKIPLDSSWQGVGDSLRIIAVAR
jgi:SAM-dependent methyltransferase